ncbi:MAG TPA: tetratricopeptide repeat protein [Anaerolineae bacterium]|nr:tetratricopeptide repeat protein [Anaerolineae bacterium]
MNHSAPKAQVNDELRTIWAAQAIELAMMGRWDEAVPLNLQVLQIFPSDVQARNRLGKAYLELGRYEEALEEYEHTLKLELSNNIARKRVAELYTLLNRDPADNDAPDDAGAEEE